jgi:cell division transport system permease protein
LLIEENLHRVIAGWSSGIQLFAYLNNGLGATEAESLTSRVAGYREVERARFVSRGEAWESFKKSLGSQSAILDGVSADALPASLEISLKPTARDPRSAADVARRLREEKGVMQVDYPEEWTEKLNLLLLTIESAKWILGGLLLVAALLIVVNSAKLAVAARREEIEIMLLVGAPPASVRLPFVIEGIAQGLAGAALSLLLLSLLFHLASVELPGALGAFGVRELRFLEPGIWSALLLLGCGIGAAGNLVSFRRHL